MLNGGELLKLRVNVCNLERGDHLVRFGAAGELDHGLACFGVVHHETIGRGMDFEHGRHSKKKRPIFQALRVEAFGGMKAPP